MRYTTYEGNFESILLWQPFEVRDISCLLERWIIDSLDQPVGALDYCSLSYRVIGAHRKKRFTVGRLEQPGMVSDPVRHIDGDSIYKF